MIEEPPVLNLFRPKDGAIRAPRLARGGLIDVQDRFLLGEKTSQGSMSRVYRALDRVSRLDLLAARYPRGRATLLAEWRRDLAAADRN